MARTEKILSIKVEGVKQVIDNLEEANAAIRALNKRQDELKQQLAQTTDAKAYVAIAEEIKAVNAEIRELEAFSATAFGTLGADAKEAAIGFSDLDTRINQTGEALNDLGSDTDGLDTSADNIALLKQQLRDIEVFGSEAFAAVRGQIDPTDRSLDGLKGRVESLEDALGGVEVGTEQFRALSTELNRTEKQIEAARLEGEALALGFNALDPARSTAEGLSVQITALEAAFSSANDEAERAGISQEIARLEFALEDVQSAAKQGIFPPGSLGALNAELENLENQIRRVPAGSAEFDRIKAQLDDVQTQTEVLSLSVQDQQRLYEDLGVSIVSSIGQLGGILQSIGADSEEAQEALLALEQATAAVGLIQQAVELKRQAQKAATLAAIKAETAATEENTEAQRDNARATGGAASATEGLAGGLENTSKAGKGFRGVLKGIGAAIKANPLLFLASALIGIGAAVAQLAKKFQPLSDALDVIDDALGGVKGAFKALIDSGDSIVGLFQSLGQAYLDYLAVPLEAIKGAFNFITGQDDPFAGLEDAAQELQASLNEVGEAAGSLGDKIADGYEKGAARARQLRELERQEVLNQVSDLAAEREEAELGSANATASARRAIRVRELQEDRALQLQRLKLENELTDEEINIIRSGNEEKIKEIGKLVNKRGEVNEKVLESVKALQQSEIAIQQEREQAFQESIQRQIASVDRRLQIEEARLATVQNLANEEAAIEARLEAEKEKLRLQNRAGEFATRAEFLEQLEILELNAANDRAELERQRIQNAADLRQIARDGELAELDDELDRRREIGDLTLQQEQELIDRRFALQREGIEEEISLLDLRTEDGVKRRAELTGDLAELQREQSKEATEAIISDIERRAEAERRTVELQREFADSFEPLAEIQKIRLEETLAAQQRLADAQSANAVSLRRQYEAANEQVELINQQTEVQIANIRKAQRAQEEALQRRREDLELEQQTIQEQLAAGVGNAKELQDELESISNQLREIGLQEVKVEQVAEIDVQNARREGEEQAEALTQGVREGLLNSQDALKNEIDQFFTDLFGNEDGQLIQQLAGQTADALNQIRTVIAEARVSAIDDEIAERESQIETISDNIERLNEDAKESAETIAELQGQLEESQGARAAALNAQISEETERRNELTQSIRAQEAAREREATEQKRLEAEKEQIQRRQFAIDKAFNLAQAISNTALAVTNALSAFSPPLSIIAAAAAGAAGAAQIATIASTQFSAEDGGELGEGPGGRPVLYAAGGEVRGPSHSAGGVRGTGRFNNIEVEGGEFIVNKRSTKKYKPLLEQLNNFGNGGELPLFRESRMFAAGGTLEPSAAVQRALTETDTAIQTEELSGRLAEISKQRIQVAVTDINEAQRRVDIQDAAGEF